LLQECIVRKLTQLVLVAATLMATPAFAEMKIAVMNYQMALLESDAAKKYAVDAEKKFGPQLSKLKQLESDAKRIQDRLVKDAEKMQQAERERLELEFKQKARDFQFQSKELNEAKAISDRDMLKQLKPKLDKAVEEVIKQGNYDLVLERGAVVDVKPQYEITRQVIQRMNSQR
jgi:outer membrane protein